MHAPAEIPPIKLTNLQRRNLFLVTKESLNNSLKHAQATAVNLKLDLEGQWVKLEIEDNGKGFQSDKVRRSANGLKNMKGRIEELKGTFDIKSGPGRTVVSYGIPLENA